MDCRPPDRSALGAVGGVMIILALGGNSPLWRLAQRVSAMDAVSAAHAVDLAAIGARRRRIGQWLAATHAIGRSCLVRLLALRARNFFGDAPLFQIGLDLACGKIAVLDVLRQVDPDKLVKPALRGRDRGGGIVEL